MKTNMKNFFSLTLVILMVILSGCGQSAKMLQELTNDNIGMTAYVYQTKLSEGQRYCLSLLKNDEELDINEAPNVYISEYLFEVQWDGNNLKVKQNEMDTQVIENKVISDVIISFGEVDGIKKEAANNQGTKKAYLYLRTKDGKKEYCLSLLDINEKLNMKAEPNIYKSPYEFNFEWSEDMLAVIQNEKDTSLNDMKMIDDIMVVFGGLSGTGGATGPEQTEMNQTAGVIKETPNDSGTKKAYLYLREVGDSKEYCLSLLDVNETLDMTSEPNIYKSEYEFDFEWDADMLKVIQNENDTSVNDPIMIDDIMAVIGKTTD